MQQELFHSYRSKKISGEACIYDIYYVYFQQKLLDHGNYCLTKKEKSDRLERKHLRSLSVLAASKGTNLKNFIEGILDRVAEDYDDNNIYAWLVKNRPEGQVKLNEKEKKDFETWLGI